MEHAFPSRFEWEFLSGGETITLYFAAFSVAGSLVGLCLTYCVKPSPKFVTFWFAVAVASPFGLWISHAPFENNWRHAAGAAPLLNASFWAVLATSVFGTILADFRLTQSGKKSELLRLLSISLRVLLYTSLALLMMAWMGTQGSGRRTYSPRSECRSHLKQIGIALHNYHQVHSMFPAAQISTPPISWRVQTLPYIDHESLWEEYVPEKTWDSDTNEPIAKTHIPTYKCPSRKDHADGKDDSDRFYTDYTMLTGDGAFSGHNASTRMRDITDGMSNTLAVVEATGLNIVWTEPRDVSTTQLRHAINYPGNEQFDSAGIASSWHRAGAHALFADGKIRFFSEKIDPTVLKALTTTQGEEEIPWSEVEKR